MQRQRRAVRAGAQWVRARLLSSLAIVAAVINGAITATVANGAIAAAVAKGAIVAGVAQGAIPATPANAPGAYVVFTTRKWEVGGVASRAQSAAGDWRSSGRVRGVERLAISRRAASKRFTICI